MEPGPTNLRDVGLTLASLGTGAAHTPLPGAVLLRSGEVDLFSHRQLLCPATVLNLRERADDWVWLARADGACHVATAHIPKPNRLEVYSTELKDVRQWLCRVLAFVASDECSLPVLVHCRSGKDRTGVVVGCLLAVLDVPVPTILREFALSTGLEPKHSQLMAHAMRHVVESCGGVRAYLRGAVDVDALRAKLTNPPSTAPRRVCLASACQLFHDTPLSLVASGQLVGGFPDHLKSRLVRGKCLAHHDQLQEALAVFDAVDGSPDGWQGSRADNEAVLAAIQASRRVCERRLRPQRDAAS